VVGGWQPGECWSLAISADAGHTPPTKIRDRLQKSGWLRPAKARRLTIQAAGDSVEPMRAGKALQLGVTAAIKGEVLANR